MKKFNFIYGAVAAVALIFASCSNEQPKFDDADAFVAFTKSAVSIDEIGGSVEVPVLLTSLGGLEEVEGVSVGTVGISVDPSSTAVKGVHYEIEGTGNLSFTKDAPTQTIKVKILDNDKFTGDVKLVLTFNNVIGKFSEGKNNTCTITIVDDEHPLGFLLGSYACQGESNFGGTVEDVITIVKDEKDINTVWIGNMVPGGTSKQVYGIVNEDRTEIKIPVGQTIATSSSYPSILLHGFAYPEYDEIETGGNITAHIVEEDGQIYIVIQDFYGSHVFDASGAELGWIELLLGSVWTKQ